MEVLNYLEEIMKNEMVMEFSAMYFWYGFIFYMAFSVIEAGINYLTEEARLVKDYQKAFYELYKYNPYILNEPCHKIPDFKYVLLGAVRRHEKRLNKKKKFKNLFKKEVDD